MQNGDNNRQHGKARQQGCELRAEFKRVDAPGHQTSRLNTKGTPAGRQKACVAAGFEHNPPVEYGTVGMGWAAALACRSEQQWRAMYLYTCPEIGFGNFTP
eukprot:1168325-Prymnesium_polylepis.1